jgi:exonuclease III
MAKAFSVASWNVEHFKGDPARVATVVAFLRQQDPDVFALYEVEGKEVFAALTAAMPSYSFHITEGPQIQEILVGVRHGLTSFFTQRTEFKSKDNDLRPGALLTLTVDGARYSLLFLHTKSGTTPRGMGLRDDMLDRATAFRKVLDDVPGAVAPANFVFMGDLNTMGMEYPYDRDIASGTELRKLDAMASRRKMRRLTKTATATWSNGSQSSIPDSNLDHVVAAKHLAFRSFQGVEVDVRGWPKLATAAERDSWIATHSDHALLYFEVQKV